MNFRDFISAFLLVLFATVVVQYFMHSFFPGTYKKLPTDIKSGQSVQVAMQDLTRPLNGDVDFYDVQVGKDALAYQTTVTNYAQGSASFSAYGATLQSHKDLVRSPKGKLINTLSFTTVDEKQPQEQRAFLVAIDKQTPLAFEQIKNSEHDSGTTLVYRSASPQAVIEKEFLIYKDQNRIDLTLTIDPREGAQNGLRPRIFLPGLLFEDAANGTIDDMVMSGFVYSDNGSVVKKTIDELNDQAWAQPTLFGVESRYGVHTLIADTNKFATRGFFIAQAAKSITAVIEGPLVHEKTTWKMSFYCGPKEQHSMVMVDARLEQLLKYGWFAWLSRGLVYVLKSFYDIFGNFGWAIIFFALLLRLILLPLTIKGDRVQLRNQKRQADLERKVKYLSEKYRDDREALAKAKNEAYQEFGAGSDMLVGMLPNIIMLVVFTTLQKVLSYSPYLYKAPFLLFYTDLSAADPYYVLPMMMGLFVLVNAFTIKSNRMRLFLIFAGLLSMGLLAKFSAGALLFLVVYQGIQTIQSFFVKKYCSIK
jgi:YidC/Oxa1 family membrane protein insertase